MLLGEFQPMAETNFFK